MQIREILSYNDDDDVWDQTFFRATYTNFKRIWPLYLYNSLRGKSNIKKNNFVLKEIYQIITENFFNGLSLNDKTLCIYIIFLKTQESDVLAKLENSWYYL